MSSTEPIITIEDGHLPTENSAIMIEDDVLQEDEGGGGGGGGDEHAGQQEQVEQEEQAGQDEEQAEDEVTPFQTRKRKKTSAAWLEFKVINAFTAKCNWCKRNMATKPGGPTTTLIRHLKGCAMRQLNDKSQKRLNVNKPSAEPITSPENFVYDHAKVREAAAHMILIHEHPFNHMEHEMFNIFMRTVSPYWKKISRATVKQDCVSTYEIEKKKLKNLMKTVGRISITIDLWKSGQDIEYMVVTGHFVIDWKLYKRILNFVHVPPPISGVVLSDALYKCLEEWAIEEKIASITVDNASYNDSAVRILRENFSLKKKLLLGGKMFHVRCTAHIINLLVQDGLKEIQHIIENVRKSVKYLSLSEARLIKFSEIAKQLKLPSKKLILDCPTRWNSTYAMLAAALEFKEVFPRYSDRDPCYLHLPSSEDWTKAESVCEFLGVFNEVTTIISGSEYPTSNLFLSEVWRVKQVLNKSLEDERPYIQAMAFKMEEKFEKYWGDCNLLMAIGSVLDPRNKMMLIGYCFKEIYPELEASRNIDLVRRTLGDLYNEYAINHTKRRGSSLGEAQQCSQSSSSTTSGLGKNMLSGRAMYQSYVMQVDSVQPAKSDLDVYLEEGVFICGGDGDDDFDALEWWKANNLKFRILSKMASDILSIPITTVASESAFSAGGRVIDPHRASLSTDTVQVLMCGADWARNLRGIKKSLKIRSDNNGIQEIILP